MKTSAVQWNLASSCVNQNVADDSTKVFSIAAKFEDIVLKSLYHIEKKSNYTYFYWKQLLMQSLFENRVILEYTGKVSVCRFCLMTLRWKCASSKKHKEFTSILLPSMLSRFSFAKNFLWEQDHALKHYSMHHCFFNWRVSYNLSEVIF